MRKIVYKPKYLSLCLVKGNMNAVNIDSNKLVSYLYGVKADELKLWKVEIPDNRDDQLSNLSLQDWDELFATKKIRNTLQIYHYINRHLKLRFMNRNCLTNLIRYRHYSTSPSMVKIYVEILVENSGWYLYVI